MALQADGWYLRSSIIWAKGISFCPTYSGSCMPESVRDRPTNSYEHVFLLSKNKSYYYDSDAVRENFADGRMGHPGIYNRSITADQHPGTEKLTGNMAPGKETAPNPAGRNLRSVWTQPDRDAFAAYCAEQGVDFNTLLAGFLDGQRDMKDTWVLNPGSFKGSHFATFSPKLVEPMIRAGTSAKGVCPKCLSPWVRVTTVSRPPPHVPDGKFLGNEPNPMYKPTISGYLGTHNGKPTVTTTGWRPTCNHGTEHPIPQEELDADPTLLDDFEIEPFDPIPATVLDPFAGTFTTGDVAIRLGRCAVGIELSKTYCDEHIIPRLSAGLQMELL